MGKGIMYICADTGVTMLNKNIGYILREDIKIILNAANKAGEKKDLSWLGISQAELASDIWMYIMESNSPSILKYKEQWHYRKWEDTESNRKQHRAWISLYIKRYLSTQFAKQKNKKKIEKEYWEYLMDIKESVDKSYKELEKHEIKTIMSLIKEAASNELEKDMIKWKMEMYTREELAAKYDMSVRTLQRRWNKFKLRILATSYMEKYYNELQDLG